MARPIDVATNGYIIGNGAKVLAIATEGYLTIPAILINQDNDSFNYHGNFVKAKIFNKYLNDEDEVALLSTYIFSLIKGI